MCGWIYVAAINVTQRVKHGELELVQTEPFNDKYTDET